MRNVKINIPEKHYCGMQTRSNESIPLGFITPYGTNSAAQKRMSTVDKWASNYAAKKTLPSQILDNVPISGFKLSDTIKRVSSWGSGNVIWRIDDPRGFELEITNNNLMQIMLCASIIDTEIMCPCVWGREGANNILIPIDSPLYKNAIKNTERQSKKISIKDVQPGNNVVLQNGTTGVYLGSFFDITFNDSSSNEYPTRLPKIDSKKKHFILTKIPEHGWRSGKECILAIASPKIAEIKNTSTITLLESQEIINSAINKEDLLIVDGRWNSIYSFIGVTSDNNTLLSLTLEEINDIINFSKERNNYFTKQVVIADIGNPETLLYTNTSCVCSANDEIKSKYDKPKAFVILRSSLENGVIKYKFIQQLGHSRASNSYFSHENIELTEILPRIKKWYSITFNFVDSTTGASVHLPI